MDRAERKNTWHKTTVRAKAFNALFGLLGCSAGSLKRKTFGNRPAQRYSDDLKVCRRCRQRIDQTFVCWFPVSSRVRIVAGSCGKLPFMSPPRVRNQDSLDSEVRKQSSTTSGCAVLRPKEGSKPLLTPDRCFGIKGLRTSLQTATAPLTPLGPSASPPGVSPPALPYARIGLEFEVPRAARFGHIPDGHLKFMENQKHQW